MAFPPPHGGPSSFNFSMAFQPSQSHPARHTSSSSAAAGARGSVPDAPISNSFLPVQEDQFDIFEWYPHFQSCLRYFLDHAQYSMPVQALAAFMNIQLPVQRSQHPVFGAKACGSPSAGPSSSSRTAGKLPMPNPPPSPISLNPYIRRLVATGFDVPAVLHGFFGDNWAKGIGHIHEVERRNYLFAAKSASWVDVKSHYDMDDEQSVPFLRPLQNVSETEIVSAEKNWSEWLAMQDWMLGPRSLESIHGPLGEKSEDF
ncbi:uncharacterized protein BCR38DRAFT_418175 [Pseudomassariella vexata]|uniref:Ilp is an apoptosis inhibitor n=1 Tax=Pseudomassariella vexata TaxID=1141098 RepID=A0A1Y2EJV3_9PEZI|nr:uncharacterized protein BCR38DRAFT_418175 [Pseudomassariella vexata]ORY71832.1 hypothetical protein BCR38DRAFT_418175 [Pseudomassariella vexata]